MSNGSVKKVLHIVEDLNVGGLENVLASIVLSLDKTKYHVHVWCLARGGEIAEELIAKGIAVRILEMESYYSPLQIVVLACLMKKEQFHIIHTHGYFASTFGRLAAILIHIPVIIAHVHSTYYDYSKRNLLIERFLSFFTDKIICISKAVEKFVTVNEGIGPKKTCLIYNAVDLPIHFLNNDFKEQIRKSLGIVPEATVITVVASLTANKGHRILLEAFARLCRDHQDLILVIVGDGPLRTQLENNTRHLMIDTAVIFTGIRKDVFQLLQASDIFVLPSQNREGLGIALIEAMAMHLPVIGTALGGIPEVIMDGENGILVDPGSSEQLAAAVMKLVDDPAMRVRMGLRGRQLYEEMFTHEQMMQRIEALYDDLGRRKSNVAYC